MTRQTESKPATVPLAQQAGEIPAEWRWVKPCAWTIRMLTALLTGVKGQKWFRLIDKVFAERNLWAAFQQVAEKKGAAGADRVTVAQFEKQLPDSISHVNQTLRGWFTYFQHCRPPWVFEQFDRWLRMRLRSILRKRRGRKGRGRGQDHKRWPNRCFARLGLYNLKEAHPQLVRSLTR